MNNKVFQHTLHRKLWEWLGDNTDKTRDQWHRWVFNGGDVENIDFDCFACEYAGTCDKCPLQWTEKGNDCGDGGAWEQWNVMGVNGDKALRREFALHIAGLPVRDGVICV